MTDPAWIDAALSSARPQAVGALLRYFRDLDTAEQLYLRAASIARAAGDLRTVGMAEQNRGILAKYGDNRCQSKKCSKDYQYSMFHDSNSPNFSKIV